jgi:uncharacterized protein (DUF1778 family)
MDEEEIIERIKNLKINEPNFENFEKSLEKTKKKNEKLAKRIRDTQRISTETLLEQFTI